jgi:GNAT superfamily N-acetyltransferase
MPYEIALPGGYVVSDDTGRLDMAAIQRFLAEDSYWARGRPLAITRRAIAGSLCLGLYAGDGSQAGFARVVTDRALMAHLADVFILPAHRGGGHGKALVAAMLAHPELVTVRRWTLSTSDAHGLYASLGFGPLPEPDNQMQRMTGS